MQGAYLWILQFFSEQLFTKNLRVGDSESAIIF